MFSEILKQMRFKLMTSWVALVTLCPVLPVAFSGEVCEFFCFTTNENITELLADCSNRQLDDVTGDLPENITYLNLAENNITKLNGTKWKRYKLLKGLSLSSNKLQNIQENDFQGLANLEMLDLSLNRIRYTNACIHENVFRPLKALTYLDIKQNLSDIWSNETYPQAILNLTTLQTLMIDGLDTPFHYYLPRLNELYLSGEYGRCNISILTKWYFTANHNIQNLFISKCSIQWIEPCSFEAMNNISSLDLSGNTDLSLDVMDNISCIATIKQINLNSLYDYIYYDSCSSLTMSAAQYLSKTSIELLTLESNYMIRMDDQAAQYFPPSLKYLSISDNLFMYGNYVETLIKRNLFKNLLYFDISKMFKTHITNTPKYTLSDKIQRLNTERNTKCLKVTKEQFELKRESMFIRIKKKDYFTHIRERVSVNHTRFDNSVKLSIDPNEPIIQYLDVSQNHPETYQLAARLFRNASHLIFLNASNNYLGYPDVASEGVSKRLPLLQTLDISNNQLIQLDYTAFDQLSSLRYLYLGTNRITNLSFDMSNLKDLAYLDVQENHLEQVPALTRNALDRLTSKNIAINLAKNPLKCTCHNFDFVKWLRTTKVRFDNLSETNCTFDNGTQTQVEVLDYDAFVLECSPPKFNTVILITSLGLMFFVVIVSCGIVYRYKWNLRYLYYMTKFKLTSGLQPIENTQFEKDVFVSYANEDGGFVYHYVVPELEQKGNISLLVHDRDFKAGELVADNIMRAITSSRKTLAILTRAYIQSKWCMYELNMARMEAADTGRNVLCVILKEDVPTTYLPVEVIEIIKKKTYLEIPEAEEHMEGFWERLRATLTN